MSFFFFFEQQSVKLDIFISAVIAPATFNSLGLKQRSMYLIISENNELTQPSVNHTSRDQTISIMPYKLQDSDIKPFHLKPISSHTHFIISI